MDTQELVNFATARIESRNEQIVEEKADLQKLLIHLSDSARRAADEMTKDVRPELTSMQGLLQRMVEIDNRILSLTREIDLLRKIVHQVIN